MCNFIIFLMMSTEGKTLVQSNYNTKFLFSVVNIILFLIFLLGLLHTIFSWYDRPILINDCIHDQLKIHKPQMAHASEKCGMNGSTLLTDASW